jgi:malonyl CoA-acyl carrier protein transacylase
MEILNEEKIDVFVELGSGKVLSGLARRISRSWESAPSFLNIEDSEALEKIGVSL